MRYQAIAHSARWAKRNAVNSARVLMGRSQPPFRLPDRRRRKVLRREIESSPNKDELIAYWRDLALTDELTGCPNRAAWARLAEMAHDSQATIAVLDIDGLKWINDNLGYSAGDQLIRVVADSLRSAGVEIYRMGGDEFYARFECDIAARLALSTINKELANRPFEFISTEGALVRTLIGAQFTFGVGQSEVDADENCKWARAERERTGLRAPRGEKPPMLQELLSNGGRVPVEPKQGPLGYYSGMMWSLSQTDFAACELIGAVI